MNRFYVTLPSNSSADYYPKNTVARYTTKLAYKIELKSEWEVGLAEISFPSEVENVVYGQCYVDLYINDVLIRRVTLPSGHHKSRRYLTHRATLSDPATESRTAARGIFLCQRQNIDKVAREHRHRVQSRLGSHVGASTNT